MLEQVKAKLYSLTTSTAVRTVFVLLVIAALALATGAPDAWGGSGPGAGG